MEVRGHRRRCRRRRWRWRAAPLRPPPWPARRRRSGALSPGWPSTYATEMRAGEHVHQDVGRERENRNTKINGTLLFFLLKSNGRQTRAQRMTQLMTVPECALLCG